MSQKVDNGAATSIQRETQCGVPLNNRESFSKRKNLVGDRENEGPGNKPDLQNTRSSALPRSAGPGRTQLYLWIPKIEPSPRSVSLLAPQVLSDHV